jgi:hypothetical protein
MSDQQKLEGSIEEQIDRSIAKEVELREQAIDGFRKWASVLMMYTEIAGMGALIAWSVFASPEPAQMYILAGMSAAVFLALVVMKEIHRRQMVELREDFARMLKEDRELTEKFFRIIGEQHAKGQPTTTKPEPESTH